MIKPEGESRQAKDSSRASRSMSSLQKNSPVDELKPILKFFKNRQWKPFPFQIESWEAFLKGESGLLHVPTGSGKTYAAVMGPFARFMAKPKKGLRALYITPLRALARDLELAL